MTYDMWIFSLLLYKINCNQAPPLRTVAKRAKRDGKLHQLGVILLFRHRVALWALRSLYQMCRWCINKDNFQALFNS